MGMAETVVIDIEARYRDQTSSGVRSTTDDVDRLRRKLGETESAGEKARASMEKIATTAKTIAKTAVSIPIKIIDYATKPIRSLINYATSLKGILTGIVMGQAAQKLFVAPTQYAETLKTHSLAFENLLGSAEKAEQMIKDIQTFDEKSPFNTMQIIEQSRMLMTYKLANEKNVLQMIETIGDAAMGVGAGDQGIERIVRALGQMKAKGKVSAEEMLQLSEVNISGWQYLADAMGVSTAEVQEMTSKNKIPVDTAINALIEGMRKDFGGMANTNASKTLSGVWGQITSVLENGPYLQWGKGLDEGAMQMATKLSGWLEESKEGLNALGDAAYELGRTMSTYAAEKFIDFGESVKSVLNSDEFKNAETMPQKLKIAWDKVIAEPFSQWWDSEGMAFVGDVAGKIGTGLGKFYNGTILTILGLDVDGAAEDGLSIGAKFAQGFLEGFDAEKVWESVKDAFGRMLGSAGKLFPGGEKADAGSWLSAILLGVGAGKVASVLSPAFGGFGGLARAGAGALTGSTKAAELAIMMGGGNLAGGASLSAGALSALGIGAGAGIAVGGVGLLSAVADLKKAVEIGNSKDKNVSAWSAGSKASMVAAGAGTGALIGSVVPVIGTAIGAALGAGVGGLGALFAGSKVGQSISDFVDGTGAIKAAAENVRETGKAFSELNEKASGAERLMSRYEELQATLDKMQGVDRDKYDVSDVAAVQNEMKSVIQELTGLYPNLLTQYDLENDKLSEKFELIRSISKEQRDQARREAEMAAYEGNKQVPEINEKLGAAESEKASHLAAYDKELEMAKEILGIQGEFKEVLAMPDHDSPEYQAQIERLNEKVADFDRRNGQTLQSKDFVDGSAYESMMDDAGAHLQAANDTDTRIEELRGMLQDIYKANVAVALNPADADLADLEAKAKQIKAYQEEITKMQEDLKGKEAGTDEYKQIEQKISDTKVKQDELTKAVEKYREPVKKAVDDVKALNRQFDRLPTELKVDINAAGISNLLSVLGYRSYTGAPTDVLDPITGTTVSGWASGTTSAPAGLAWVGENGPELIRMRGGERVYNADQSRRIAEQNASRSAQEGQGGGQGVEINLGGINVTVSANEASGDVVEALRARMPEIGNELCSIIAVQMDKIYANMPTRVEGIT